ncbi:MAG: polysaccharide deacetylase family protein [Dyadobacter sp.]|uniref:polysaccharide deacetylase family protein n=1 Tax=Dyadobacter sp. TaxID=1914288 RepID=UPI001B08FE36|nr:polysaccharide deacetylase family protein [Dyadobacter sp.]MBO9616875.1 polysaccharide deacetylase family protein [Dyadobacter sp.]
MRQSALWLPKTGFGCNAALILIAMLVGELAAQAQSVPVALENDHYLRQLYADTAYRSAKERVSAEFAHARAGSWGEFVKGVDEDIVTGKKLLALTFDACGGPHGSGYDAELIGYLEKMRIPATLFVTGKWIDANYGIFTALSKNSLFEIENHGLNHRPCSVDGESEYGIKGTPDVPDAFDEIEANERKIEAVTGRRPIFFRSATAFTDEACAKIARQLGVTMISFDVLSGDAVPNTPTNIIESNILKHVRPGALIIMHFNHPEWNSYEALQKVVPALLKSGYTFVRLKDYSLKGR